MLQTSNIWWWFPGVFSSADIWFALRFTVRNHRDGLGIYVSHLFGVGACTPDQALNLLWSVSRTKHLWQMQHDSPQNLRHTEPATRLHAWPA